MRFDLNGDGTGEGFKFFESRITDKGDVVYDEPKADAATFFLRSMAPKVEEFQGKRKRKYEWVLNTQSRSMERVGYFEELSPEESRKQTDDLWDYVITGWDDKALLPDGKPIPVTRENKLRLMKLPVFDRFVARCLQLMASSGVKQAEAAEANLSPGPPGP